MVRSLMTALVLALALPVAATENPPATMEPLPTDEASFPSMPGALPSGPALLPDTLSASHRAALQAELSRLERALPEDHAGWELGETSFLRLTREERDRRLAAQPWPAPIPDRESGYRRKAVGAAPKALDWRRQRGGFVTGVRDQGDCAGGWAYAATACLESAVLLAIDGGRVPDFDLSETLLMDCLPRFGLTSNCRGGFPEDCLWFASTEGVVEEGDDLAGDRSQEPCSADAPADDRRRFRFADYGFVCHGYDLDAIRDALRVHGPLVTTMTVHDSFEGYRSGVYRASGSVTGYHAVTLVGYNDAEGYFIAKNSWGEGWGMGGFFLIAYDSGCDFGNWTAYARYEPVDRELFGFLAMDTAQPQTNRPVLFEDRSVSLRDRIVKWEWDFDGDGRVDAQGPGPHRHRYARSGTVVPSLRIVDAASRSDRVVLAPLQVTYAGPRWVVDAEAGSAYGDGSPERPFLRIQSALNRAQDGDTVRVRPGHYRHGMDTQLSPMGKRLVLMGEGELGDVILDGRGRNRLLILDQGEGPGLIVENLVFRNGYDPERGGAVLIQDAAPTFRACRFEACKVGPSESAAGGAVWAQGAPRFEHCSFTGNSSSASGGALAGTGELSLLVLTDCLFLNNEAELGGGALRATDAAIVILDGHFEGNGAGSQGGALSLRAVEANIERCVFHGNQVSSEGGGVTQGGGALALSRGSQLQLSSSILAENEAPLGGAIHLFLSSAELTQVSSWGNRAEEAGGSLACYEAKVSILNSIFWRDTAPEFPEILAPVEGEALLEHCLVMNGFAGTGILDADPRFQNPEHGDFRLDEQSPALGAGLPLEVFLPDLVGQPRPQPPSSLPDLGALESPLAGETIVQAPDTAPALSELGIYPNPFNLGTTLSFELAQAADVRLLVYSSTGRLVATVFEGGMSPGRYQMPWTPEAEGGQVLASGIFFVRLECRYTEGRDEVQIQKAILVK